MNCFKEEDEVQNLVVKKIPRPPNAFMLFANANRKIMAQRHPTESNKDISKRLGSSWKSLDSDEKNKYFERAKAIDNEHKRKYPNYVYNPKEARIRKAMREATRDRSIGGSPMLPRPSERIPQHTDWAPSAEDPLMMSPMGGMRRMDSPLCNYSLQHSENNQYLSSMNGYNKMESSSMMSNYLQPSPLAQLQQQTDMWHPYQESMRPRPLGTPFHHSMMPDIQPSTYHSQEPVQETATNLIMEKPRQSPGCASHGGNASPQVPEKHRLTPPLTVAGSSQQEPQTSQNHFLETKMSPERMQTTMLDNHQQETQFTPVPESIVSCNNFESSTKCEPVTVPKKVPFSIERKPGKSEDSPASRVSKSSQYFSDKNQIEYINNYFAASPEYTLLTINTRDGFNFPYASLSPNGYKSSKAFLEISAMNNEPHLIPTDIGYIPVLESDFCVDSPDMIHV